MQLAAERLAQAFTKAGLPKDVLQVLHLSPELTEQAVKHKSVSFVSFTGSVAGGLSVERAAVASGAFKGVALEVLVLHHGLRRLTDSIAAGW